MVRKTSANTRYFIVWILLGVLLTAPAWAQSKYFSFSPQQSMGDSKARLAYKNLPSPSSTLHFEPLTLRGGTELTVISPKEWTPLTEIVTRSLRKMHLFFSELFGPIPSFSTTLQLMDEETFFKKTGAPRWTNAMYYKKKILIPLTIESEGIDVVNLLRSIRHEYTHAITAALSKGKCPGWLDEGLAQWAEGVENPALEPALRNWLKIRKPISLASLKGGFTKLTPAMVPPAYAESLFAANTVIDLYGFSPVRVYMNRLRRGSSSSAAFKAAFNVSEGQFEKRLDSSLKHWARQGRSEAEE